MAILNYTTKIETNKTAGEIQKILSEAGADAVLTEYSDSKIVAISFRFKLNEQLLSFRLPINSTGVLRALMRVRGLNQRFQTIEQAERTAWRIVKDWILAQLALVDAQQADLVEVFMPYLQTDNGNTVYEHIKSGNYSALQITEKG